jgi:hypothetical protein
VGKVRRENQEVWLWAAIEATTKVVPVLKLGLLSWLLLSSKEVINNPKGLLSIIFGKM